MESPTKQSNPRRVSHQNPTIYPLSHSTTPQNLTKEEHRALLSLKQNPDIIIKPADKGNSTVIQNKPDYIEKDIT